MKNVCSCWFWFAEKNIRRRYNYHQFRKEAFTLWNAVFPTVKFSVDVLSSLKRAVSVFWGLETYAFLALGTISVWGFTTVDICCCRGVTRLALTALVKALGVCHQQFIKSGSSTSMPSFIPPSSGVSPSRIREI
jgi:hypothetical protein